MLENYVRLHILTPIEKLEYNLGVIGQFHQITFWMIEVHMW